MNNKWGASHDALDIIKQNISLSEEKRKQSRLEHNLAQLVQGDIQILKNDEFIQGLVDFLLVDSEEKKDLKRKLLINLGEAAIFEDITIRERTLTVLSLAGENFLQKGDKVGILLVFHSFCKWLEYEKEILPGLVVVIKRLEELTLWLLDKSFWKEGEKIIALFHHIQNGVHAKGTAFKSLIANTLDRFATKANFEQLTDGYLLEDSLQPLFGNILLSFETRAAKYLWNRCIQSLSRKERLLLLDLLAMFGSPVLPILEECLENKPPWTVVRNVLSLLSIIGNDSCYSFIKHCFGHEDKRIQYEMICCVVKLAACELKNRLLDGLVLVHDDLKIYVLQLLVQYAARDEMVISALYNFIETRDTFSPRSKNKLIGAAIAAVKAFPCIKSIEILRNLQDDYDKVSGEEQIKLQIEEAMKSMIPKLRHHRQRSERSSEPVSFDTDPQQLQKAFTTLTSIEENLRKLVRAGDMTGAGRLLHEQALFAARARDFFLAEKLRDRLLEIDPMALAAAVALGDLIEEEKTTSHTSHHLGVWNELYEEMTTEEFNALYSVLRQEEYRKDDIIVRAGEADDVLYFLNTGYISLSCMFGGHENFLKRMGASSILGGEQFFSASVWTVTLKALTDVHLQILDHAVFLNISENFPGMEEKLRQYCHNYAGVPALLKMSGDDRREYPRFPVTIFTQNVLLDPYGNKGKRSFKGELTDISRNGFAFNIKISSRKNAKLLLGRQIFSELQMADGEVLVECSGVIVGVRYHDVIAKDSTIHVKLSQKIENTAFSRIIALHQ